MNRKRDFFYDMLFFVLGTSLLGLSISCFAAPNNIASGGITGVAIVIFSLFSFPVGTTALILNIPILIVGLKNFGFKFIYKTLIATVMMAVAIDVFALFIPSYVGDKLLACLFGGFLSGLGLAVIFLRGSTTGGVDIIAKIVNKKHPQYSIGKIILALDFVIIAFAAVSYGSIESALYAIIFTYVQSRVVDSLVYGSESGKIILINSKKFEQISQRIMFEMKRGVTILEGSGAYTKNESKIIMCAVRKYEAVQIHRIVREIDENAFVVTFEAGEIKGEGFKSIS